MKKKDSNDGVFKLSDVESKAYAVNAPEYVGRYQIGGSTGMSISFSLELKPNYINRWFCKKCLGWEWIDN